MSEGALLELRGLNAHRGKRKVLQDIDFILNKGEIVVLVGDNGSGKSTFIESCAGIVPFNKGELLFFDKNDSEYLIRNHEGRNANLPMIGLTLQNDCICGEETVEERLFISSSQSSKKNQMQQLDFILSEWGLSHRKADKTTSLSGGLKRRLSVISGLAPAILSPEPIIILLDEPSVGLDESARKIFINWIRTISSKGHGIIVSSHNEEIMKCADRLIKINKEGTITESKGKSQGEIVNIPFGSSENNPISITKLVTWSTKMEIRNPIDTIGRAIPALVALLLSYSLTQGNEPVGVGILSALVLLPAFLTCIISPALINRFNEADCGKWWQVMLGAKFRPISSLLGASIILPLPLTYLSWFILIGNSSEDYSNEVFFWLWLPALSLIDVAIAASAIHFLVSDLHRANASSGSLLLIALVWPFLELSDALSTIMTSGMSFSLELGSPLMGCIIASLSSSLIWLVVVFLPDA
ncbi:MAG: ATP-binding cassette domain-containing protein [Candidatus Poseidoniales archaeon]|jgi:ABC-2 type transport system ATP-binding protein|tara:strand:+ start:3990 stop:5399 length:1410 start_codon:yes stop_codon:yes gene_type:complete